MALLTSLLFTISCLLARPMMAPPRPAIIRQQAYQAVQASLQGDYSTLLTYTYPRLIELGGGPEKMLAMMKQQGSPAPAPPIHIRIEQPGPIYPAGQELHVLVPYVLTIDQKPNAVRLRAYQLAVSQNRGKHWYFVPTDLLTPTRIRTLFPVFNARLKIPPPSKPVGVNEPSG